MLWNIQHSFEHALQFSTCAEILNTQHALQFSEHPEIFNTLFYSFQNILKFSTHFFTVFRTFWNFQHAFLQFSEHTEIFNMLFHSFQNMLKFSTRFFIVLNTLFQYAYNMHYRFQHALKFSTHFQTWKFKTFTVKFYFYVVQIYVNQGSYKLSMTDHYGGQVNNWPHSHTPSQISM